MTATIDDAWALAWLCAQLPALRHVAREDGWSADLDECLSSLRDGRRPLDVIADLGLDPAARAIHRGTGSAGTSVPWSPVAAISEYRCPRAQRSCERTAARDASGHPPVCHLDSSPMRPVPVAEGR